MNAHRIVTIAALLLIGIAPGRCGAATVASPDSAANEHASAAAPGSITRDWLRLQREGRSAGAAQPLPGAAATLLYQRYLNSFKNPIPAQFENHGGAGTQ